MGAQDIEREFISEGFSLSGSCGRRKSTWVSTRRLIEDVVYLVIWTCSRLVQICGVLSLLVLFGVGHLAEIQAQREALMMLHRLVQLMLNDDDWRYIGLRGGLLGYKPIWVWSGQDSEFERSNSSGIHGINVERPVLEDVRDPSWSDPLTGSGNGVVGMSVGAMEYPTGLLTRSCMSCRWRYTPARSNLLRIHFALQAHGGQRWNRRLALKKWDFGCVWPSEVEGVRGAQWSWGQQLLPWLLHYFS